MFRHAFSARHSGRSVVAAGEFDGRVIDALPSGLFRIGLTDNREVVAHISGELRMKVVRILPGDRVHVRVSNYDPTRGRIIQRHDS